MSRVGKRAVHLPQGVTANVAGQTVKVKGAKGELAFTAADSIVVAVDKDGIHVKPREGHEEDKNARALWGASRNRIANMVLGVAKGFTKQLEISGVGFKAAVQGKNLNLNLGYSHDIVFPIPQGIDIKCEKPTSITVSGNDRQQVGQVAAQIRGFREPEPYKGKGIKYSGETIRRKEGKKK